MPRQLKFKSLNSSSSTGVNKLNFSSSQGVNSLNSTGVKLFTQTLEVHLIEKLYVLLCVNSIEKKKCRIEMDAKK